MSKTLVQARSLLGYAAGVEVAPGSSIQAAIDANPSDATVILLPGLHTPAAPLVAKGGNTLIGRPGAVLSGGGTVAYAFQNGGSGVRLTGLTIERFNSPYQYSAIRPEAATDWVIEDCEIRFNAMGGIRTATRLTIRRCRIHHNGESGILGGGTDVVVEDCEIAYNNHLHRYDATPVTAHDPFIEAGGTKFVGTLRLILRRNYVHHNDGNGLWCDIDNQDALYEDNTIEDNTLAGILHEISFAAVIRRNTCRRNGASATPNWVDGAGILVVASPDVEVDSNTVEENDGGIVGLTQTRTDPAWVLRNLNVHDNDVLQRTGFSGVIKQGTIGDTAYGAPANNRFQANRYQLNAVARNNFQWLNASRSTAAWQGYGMDTAASGATFGTAP